MNQSYEILEYHKILEQLAQNASSPLVKEKCRTLEPYLSEAELGRQMRETSQARELLDRMGAAPIPVMEKIRELVEKAVRGELLMPEELEEMGVFLAAVRRMQDYLRRGMQFGIGASFYAENLCEEEELEQEIARCIRGGKIDDYASATLKRIRKELVLLEEKIKEKAASLLRANKNAMAENFVVNRNGRICLPVKKDLRGKIKGTVVDQSATGATLFIEPEVIAGMQTDYENLKIEEDTEERIILYTLLDEIAKREETFLVNLETLERLDFMFAKAKLSADMEAVEPEITTENYIYLKQARHPLLKKEICVPLDFELGRGKNGMIITGPNTGGKTVTIKTVGLFSLMAASGLHVPCERAVISMYNEILCDIGDGQNISDNLSTFSAHITNVIHILERVTRESLVIMDELGSGTDPAEGMGIALAIIEKLKESGCMFLVTTHYPEVKTYAANHAEIISARMGFDRENLRPLYRLEMGKTGDSCALFIAKRLGLPEEMLLFAAKEAYGDVTEELLAELKIDKMHPTELRRQPAPRIEKRKNVGSNKTSGDRFSTGDSVTVFPEQSIGIVVKPEDENGNVLIQVKKEKRLVNQKRLKLKVKAEELYPEDYDFSIIFDSVEVRKARHQMERKYVEGVEIRE